jgi:hypothetical protein
MMFQCCGIRESDRDSEVLRGDRTGGIPPTPGQGN